MDVFKKFLFPKIDFKRDIIRAKIWFPYGKRLLANNMTGQADIKLCKLGGGWLLVKQMYQELFFFPLEPKKQRTKKKKKTPDLRLINVVINWQLPKQDIRWPVLPDRIAGSGVDPSRSIIFLKLSGDKLLVFKWSQAQV